MRVNVFKEGVDPLPDGFHIRKGALTSNAKTTVVWMFNYALAPIGYATDMKRDDEGVISFEIHLYDHSRYWFKGILDEEDGLNELYNASICARIDAKERVQAIDWVNDDPYPVVTSGVIQAVSINTIEGDPGVRLEEGS